MRWVVGVVSSGLPIIIAFEACSSSSPIGVSDASPEVAPIVDARCDTCVDASNDRAPETSDEDVDMPPTNYIELWYPWEFSSGFDFFTVAPTTNSSIVVRMQSNGPFVVTSDFDNGALALLRDVPIGVLEILPAGEYAGGPGMFSTAPTMLVVDVGTTTIRGGLKKQSKIVALTPSSMLPNQSQASLRAYSAEAGKLFSLENGSLVARDVASALVGMPVSSSVTLSGATPETPLAMEATFGKVFVIDRAKVGIDGGTSDVLRLLAISNGGVCSELWRTGPIASWPIVSAFASISSFGDVVFSYTLSNKSSEVLVVRSDDGSPLRSTTVSGAMLRAALSNGSQLILPQKSFNPLLKRVLVASPDPGLCGATWFKSVVGNQSGYALGDPMSDCP